MRIPSGVLWAMILTASAMLISPAVAGTPKMSAEGGGQAQLGSADFSPTPQRPVGWRGDGSGRYPGAHPPVHWGQTSKTLQGLRVQARRPAGDEPGGVSMAGGVIHEWLVLGPFPADFDASMDKEVVPSEAQLAPDTNEAVGGKTWKLFKTDTSVVDLNAATGRQPDVCSSAFIHAYVWSEADASISILMSYRSMARVWINGEPATSGHPWWDAGKRKGWIANGHNWRATVKLKKGWNRLLMKTRSYDGKRRKTDKYPGAFAYFYWYVEPTFWGPSTDAYENSNIKWSTQLPGKSPASPIVVNDRIYLEASPDLLLCLDKESGKILWIRSNNPFEAIPAEKREADPALKALEPQAKELRTLEASFASGLPDRKTLMAHKKLRKKFMASLRRASAKKYMEPPRFGEAGCADACPASDGERVYVSFATGVTACYDLEGNRKWIRFDKPKPPEHGLTSSPVLANGKLLVYTGEVIALDALTGKEIWRQQRKGSFHSTLAIGKIGGVNVIGLPLGGIWRLADGKELFKGSGGCGQPIPSPVFEGNVNYSLSTYVRSDGTPKVGILRIRKFPDAVGETLEPTWQKEWSAEGVAPVYYCNWFLGSPLVHDGLVYCVDGLGGLHVIDASTGETVYQKLLNLSQNGAGFRAPVGSSPTLAGDYIYITGNRGAPTIVFKPGRRFEPVARNQIEGTRCVAACPVFEGKRMYLRTGQYLHCIEEK